MNLFYVIVFGLYFLLMLLLIIGWKEGFSRKSWPPVMRPSFRKVSVIVPFRDEASSIDHLLQDLLAQQYPSELIEIILVDDHSSDRSTVIVKSYITPDRSIRLLALPEGVVGKKQALSLGIANASGEIVVTTDADCRMSTAWLGSVSNFFSDKKVKMVFGGVRIQRDERLFSAIQALEFLSLIGTGASTASLGFPTMCNGANLAFLRSTFVEVGGYEGNFEVPSGDDEFLMRKIDHAFPGSIYFLTTHDSVVTTKPLSSRTAFVNQRLRWAGKWKHNSSVISQALAVFVLVFQASFLSLWLAPLLDLIDWRLAGFLIAGKLLSEYAFLSLVGSFVKTKWNVGHFILLQFLYPVYVIYTGSISQFRSYEWKGRRP